MLLLALWLGLAAPAMAEPVHLRLGLVKFGSASWEVDTVRRNGLDKKAGIELDTTDMANPAAGEVALQAGAVDAIITDWLWVARQRRAGQRIVFIPHSSALGEVVVRADSPIRSLADLKGRKLGVAGGPLDKSWLLLRAHGRKALGGDLAGLVEPVYGSPPLLSQELKGGRLDAVLTFWPFAARLAAEGGTRTIAGLADIQAGLGFSPPVPVMGYGVTESWLAAHPDGAERFVAAMDEADRILAASPEAWKQIRALAGEADDATLAALRERFAGGLLPHGGNPLERAPALYAVLAETGGADLTGGATELPPGLFR
jgi:NitT/TauT family transport system substrate-binding protein